MSGITCIRAASSEYTDILNGTRQADPAVVSELRNIEASHRNSGLTFGANQDGANAMMLSQAYIRAGASSGDASLANRGYDILKSADVISTGPSSVDRNLTAPTPYSGPKHADIGSHNPKPVFTKTEADKIKVDAEGSANSATNATGTTKTDVTAAGQDLKGDFNKNYQKQSKKLENYELGLGGSDNPNVTDRK